MSNKVDIFINGHNYAINCPAGEEEGLQRASAYINDFIQGIRRHNPQLPQEELLLLCALTLYESSEALADTKKTISEATDVIDNMLNNIKKLG